MSSSTEGLALYAACGTFGSLCRYTGGGTMSAKSRKNNAQAKKGMEETRRNRTIDALAEFDVFNASILPQLKKMVLEDWSPEKIRKAFAPIMQAQMIKKGLEGNYRAIKDTLDRHEGTAVQRQESRNLNVNMTKKELAALVLQKLKDAQMIDGRGKVLLVQAGDDETE
jgi:hypothetical protein